MKTNKRFLCFLLSIVLITLSCNENKNSLLKNESCIIVGTNEADGIAQDKFHKPVVIKKWLIRRITDTTQYAELSSYDYGFQITTEMWYSKNIGDTLHFHHIRKDRFFTIKR